MKEKDLKFKEKVLIKLILKAALKKKERLESILPQQPQLLLKVQNMN